MSDDQDTPTFVTATPPGPAAYELKFYGAVDDETAAAFEDALRHVEARTAPGTVVPLYISSTGGDVYQALKVVDLMEASPLRIETVAVGACMSAAALIFSFGARRFVGSRATIMLHGVRLEAFEGKLKDMEVEAHEMRRLNTLMWTLMSRRCGKSDDFLQKHMEGPDCYVTPAQALAMGLATDLGVPRLRVERHVRLEVEGPAIPPGDPDKKA